MVMESGNSRYGDDGGASLCVGGCGFYGTPETQNRCSKCFKELLKQQGRADVTASANTHKPKPKAILTAATAKAGPSVTSSSLDHRQEEEEEEKPKPKAIPTAATAKATAGPSLGHRREEAVSIGKKEEEEEKPKMTKKKRCETCERKVGLLGFECRCRKVLCGYHRYPGEHACTFDFKAMDRQVLVKNNPLLRADKLGYRV